VFTYDLVDSKKKGISLKKVASRCLYLDEIIDLKFLSEDYVLMCSNNEHLKLLNMKNGMMEIYQGHSNILLSCDVIKMPDEPASKLLCLSAAKDNEIRMWYIDLEGPF
jgi:hypothetical protein